MRRQERHRSAPCKNPVPLPRCPRKIRLSRVLIFVSKNRSFDHLLSPHFSMSFARSNPILVLLVHKTQSIMLRQIAYLKAENSILRSKLPKHVQTRLLQHYHQKAA